MALRFAFLALLLGLSLPDVARAGPWVPPPGRIYRQVALNHLRAADRNEYLAQYYVERGLFRRAALVAAVPLKVFDQLTPAPSGDDTGSFVGFAPTAGLRYALLEGPLVLSLQGEFRFPLGGGSVDGTGWVLAGASIPHGYVQAAGGFRARSGEDAHESLWMADLGFWLGDAFATRRGHTGQLLVVAEGRGRYQVAPDRNANLADRETQAGGQLLYRHDGRIDVGVEVLHTFEDPSVARATQGTAYVAWTLDRSRRDRAGGL